MLSVGELLLLNQLMYNPEDEKRTMDEYQGDTIGALVEQRQKMPYPDNADCGFCMKGREWNRINRLIAENPGLSCMRIESVHRDDADGGGDERCIDRKLSQRSSSCVSGDSKRRVAG